MSMSTFQKVTLATVLALCLALLLPKMLLSRGGRRDAGERPEGRLPPGMHRPMAPEGRGQRVVASGFSRGHSPETAARTKGVGAGTGAGGKSNLAGQIIPVYGFGILLYILYILFKIMSKGNNKPTDSRFPPVRSENMKRKITDFELAQLQERLQETELVMEKIVSSSHHSPDRVKGVTPDQEENLLQQLTEITRVMQVGQLVEGVATETTQKDWDGRPEECWEHSRCCCQHSPERMDRDENFQVDEPSVDIPAGGRWPGNEDMTPESNSIPQVAEDGGNRHADVDVPENGAETEAALKVKTEEPTSERSCSSVRRRNRRRRMKRAMHCPPQEEL